MITIIQEFVGGGDLFDAVVPDIGCREKTLPYIHQLCSALAYMHSKNIVHRDLKPENICVSADKQAIKIIDFGLALQYVKEKRCTVVHNNNLLINNQMIP